ncbi:MAG: polysaccharide biosynthesis C-terminal domain-containing protein [Clostridia bacterium]|nr:polysaccharide biosynthesis C-terminal domain-containing protein [Clostridia bacterium]
MSKSQREKGILLSYVTMAVNFVIGIVFTPFVLAKLGSAENGVYAAASSIIGIITLLDMGLGNSLTRFSSRIRTLGDVEGEKKLNGLFLLMFSVISVISVFVGAVIYFSMPPFLKEFTTEQKMLTQKVFLIMLVNISISFPFTAVTAILSSYERFAFLRTYALVRDVIVYGSQAVVLLCGGRSVGMAVAATVVHVLVKIVPTVYLVKKMKVGFRFRGLEFGMAKEIFSYSSFILINLLVDRLYADTDKLILSGLKIPNIVGVYNSGAHLNKDFNLFSTSISGVFLPNITKLITQKTPMEKISDIFIRIGRIQFIILSFIFSGFLIFGQRFVYFWLNVPKHPEYAEVYYIALILMAPGLVSLSQNIGVSVLQAMNKHRIRSVMYLLIAILNVVISIPLAKRWGGTGSAIGTVIGNLLGQILFMNWYYWKKIGLDIPRFWKNVVLRIGVVMAAYTALGYFVNGLLPEPSLIMLLVRIAVYSVLFVPVLWFLIANKEEKTMIREKITGIKRRLGSLRRRALPGKE